VILRTSGKNVNYRWNSRDWGALPPGTPTAWEQFCKRNNLNTDKEILLSPLALAWASRHRNDHYIPEFYLRMWGIQCD
jgi:hypothetical protein